VGWITDTEQTHIILDSLTLSMLAGHGSQDPGGVPLKEFRESIDGEAKMGDALSGGRTNPASLSPAQ
jgi:hypothetical protein